MSEILRQLYESDPPCIRGLPDPNHGTLRFREEGQRKELEALLSGRERMLFDQDISLRRNLETQVAKGAWSAGCRFGARLLRELLG